MPPFIPSYQTLGRRGRWKRQRREDLPFPLGGKRTRCYYLGRNALFHGIRALGLTAGDEIVFPAYHSGTESAPLLHAGCRLRFYGVHADLSIDLAEVESQITPTTKALYVIHFYGFPGPIAELRALADRHGIFLIEDVALSMLAHVEGRPLGTWGDISIFCLYKTAPTAAGGMLAINRDDVPLPPPPRRTSLYSDLNLTVKRWLAHVELHSRPWSRRIKAFVESTARKLVRRTRLQATPPDALDFDPNLLDWTMGPVTRWVARHCDYSWIASQRRANYQWFAKELRGTGVRMLREDLPDGAVPLFLPVLAPRKSAAVERLLELGIEAIPVWGSHHPYVPRGRFPQTEFLIEHLIELPCYQDLSESHLKRIRDALLETARWPDIDDHWPPRTLTAGATELALPSGSASGISSPPCPGLVV